jgi:hypothetical protein
MESRIRTHRFAAVAAALVAGVTLSLGVGSALGAPPAKNAERKCLDAGGQFAWEATQYTCQGLPDTAGIASAERQCRNSYKGWAFSWWRDPLTGTWSYICSR